MVLSLFANFLPALVDQFVGEMSALGSQLHFAAPPCAIAGGHDGGFVDRWVLSGWGGFGINFLQQMGDKIEERELGICEAVF